MNSNTEHDTKCSNSATRDGQKLATRNSAFTVLALPHTGRRQPLRRCSGRAICTRLTRMSLSVLPFTAILTFSRRGWNTLVRAHRACFHIAAFAGEATVGLAARNQG